MTRSSRWIQTEYSGGSFSQIASAQSASCRTMRYHSPGAAVHMGSSVTEKAGVSAKTTSHGTGGGGGGSGIGVAVGEGVTVGTGLGVRVATGVGGGVVRYSKMMRGLPPTRNNVGSRGSELLYDGSRFSW